MTESCAPFDPAEAKNLDKAGPKRSAAVCNTKATTVSDIYSQGQLSYAQPYSLRHYNVIGSLTHDNPKTHRDHNAARCMIMKLITVMPQRSKDIIYFRFLLEFHLIIIQDEVKAL